MAVLLEATSISRTYGSITALQSLDLSVVSGGYYGLIGPNGAGKSTTLHIIVGLLAPSTGDVLVMEQDLRVPESRRHIGFAPDDLPLPLSLTGAEFLTLHDRLRQRDDSVLASRLADTFGLSEHLTRQLDEYSHGMKRKIQFIAAVMHEPAVLILDEPFRGLDPLSSTALRSYLSSYAHSGRAVIVATHDLLRAERDCSYLWMIDGGRLVASGSPESIITQARSDDLEEAFSKLANSRPGAIPLADLVPSSLSR